MAVMSVMLERNYGTYCLHARIPIPLSTSNALLVMLEKLVKETDNCEGIFFYFFNRWTLS